MTDNSSRTSQRGRERPQVDLRRFMSNPGWHGPETCSTSPSPAARNAAPIVHRTWTRRADKANTTSQEEAPSEPFLLCWHLFSWFCTSLSPPPPLLGRSCPNRDSLIAESCQERLTQVSQSTTSAVYNSPSCPRGTAGDAPTAPLCTGSTSSPGSPFSHPSPLQCSQGSRENTDLNKTEPKK